MKLWWGGVWTAYEKFKNGITPNKELLRRTIAGVSEDPAGKTLVWSSYNLKHQVRKWGFLIKLAKEDSRFAYAFNYTEENEIIPEPKVSF